ncbi:TonB-dependent siderophore receptor [Seleniivibrio woodruffii]|uniref:TonB-dependent receptor plug domain-containing protein n=1 Tax=Seleniivibrio woodruffii TaxID=1078050 RepID=UPI0026EFDEDB|nr:TonB-dependent receptor [Seleniivibrio woodruffii]
MKRLLPAAMVLLMASTASADKDSMMQDTIYFDTVKVTDSAVSEGQNMKTSSATVQEKRKSNNVADFIAKDPEISLKRRTAFGDSGDILTIRGQSGQRIMLNLDGRNLNSTGVNGGNFIDFNTIPLDNIEKIEIIKGGSSAEYGNNAIGGVINAYTKRPSADPSLSFYGTMGGWNANDDFMNIRGSYSQKFGNLGISLGVSRQEADEYLWNSDYRSTHVAPKIYLTTPWKGELIAGYDYTKTRRGLIKNNRVSQDPDSDGWNQTINPDAPLSLGEVFSGGAGGKAMSNIGEGAHYNVEKKLYSASYTQPIGNSMMFELSAYKNHEDRLDTNYSDGTGGVAKGEVVLDREVEVDRSYGYKAKMDAEFGDHTLIFGAEQKNLRGGEIDVKYVAASWKGSIASSDSDHKIDNTGVFLSDSWKFSDRLTFDIGMRFDDYEASQMKSGSRVKYDDSKLTPKLGATYAVTQSDKVAMYVYQSYRTPVANEMNHYIDGLSYSVLADKDLKAETANAIDLVYKHAIGSKGFARVSAFYYDIDDYILFGSKPDGTSGRIAYNIDNAKFTGVSTDGRYDITSKLSLNAGLAWQKTEKEGDPVSGEYADYSDDKVDYIPDWKGVAGASWKFSDKFTLDASLNYVGERSYFYYGKSRELDPYTTVDAGLSYAMNEHATLEVYAENLLNRTIEEQYGYPTAGLILGASVKLVF